MKIKSKSVICMLLILAIVTIIMPKSQAAGLVISFSQSTANVGDTVTVNEDGYLCVNGTATEIKAGKYTILKDSANGIYTITLPDEKGELQTIQLAMATANITISSYWYTFSRIDEIIKLVNLILNLLYRTIKLHLMQMMLPLR